MGGFGNILGLLLEIDADPSKAEAAMQRFAASTGKSVGFVEAQMREYNAAQTAAYDEAVQRSRGAADKIDNALLSNRQSVQLLAAEFGIHLPRAVSSAIAEIIPNIALMGTGLLAVFAIEEVVKFGVEVVKLANDFNMVKEAQEQVTLAAQESDSAMEAAAKKSEKYARDQVKQLSVQLLAGEAYIQMLRDQEQGLNALNPVIGQAVQMYYFWTGHSKELLEKTKQNIEQHKLLDAIVKILGEDEDKTHKTAAEAAKHAAAEQKRALEDLNRFNQELIKERVAGEKRWQAELKQDAAELEKLKVAADRALGLTAGKPLASPFAAWAVDLHTLTEAQRVALPLEISTTNQLAMMIQRTKEYTAEMTAHHIPARRRLELQMQHEVDLGQREVEEMRQKVAVGKALRSELEAVEEQYSRLTAALQQYQQAQQQELTLSGSWTRALDEETGAIQANMAAAVEGLASEAAAMIGGRRAQAAVEGAFDAAKAIEMWARFAASYGTDAAAGIAAAKYTLAAVEMFKVAGSGGGSAGGGGGAFGGPGTYSAGGGGRAASYAPGASEARGRERPATVVINIQGDYLSTPASVDQLAALLSDAVDRRDIILKASHVKDVTFTRDSLNG